jgi:hypothetical protein
MLVSGGLGVGFLFSGASSSLSLVKSTVAGVKVGPVDSCGVSADVELLCDTDDVCPPLLFVPL